MEVIADWLPLTTLERLGAYGLLLTFVLLLVRGILVTRRTAERERESLVDGYKAKDEAHAQVLAYKEERIAELIERDKRKDELIEQREAQLGRVLDELAPSVIRWADATQEAAAAAVPELPEEGDDGTTTQDS